MFERAITNAHRRDSPELSDESDEDDESSSDDDEGFGRPMSVHDIRNQMRPDTATSGPRRTIEKPAALPRHTIM